MRQVLAVRSAPEAALWGPVARVAPRHRAVVATERLRRRRRGGGGSIEHVCGASPTGGVCQLVSCSTDAGRYCGTIGDGCGGALKCGECPPSQTCDLTGVCRPPCPLCAQIPTCASGTTTISGKVYTGALTDPDPVYNALVFIPNGTLPTLTDGVRCERCTPMSTSEAVASTISAADGSFTLSNVPAGDNIPIAVQLGHWRQQTTINELRMAVGSWLRRGLSGVVRSG